MSSREVAGAVAELIDERVALFGRLVVVELSKIRVDATAAEIARAVDNAVRRFKYEETFSAATLPIAGEGTDA